MPEPAKADTASGDTVPSLPNTLKEGEEEEENPPQKGNPPNAAEPAYCEKRIDRGNRRYWESDDWEQGAEQNWSETPRAD